LTGEAGQRVALPCFISQLTQSIKEISMRLKLLGPSGLRVSEFCLGTMTFGTAWGWGADRETSRALFAAFEAAGGNFIDTANNYTDGESEHLVGEFIRDARDRYVVASKYTLRNKAGDPHDVNQGGNSRKSMLRSVERSLKALQTDYLDLLYLHMWDFTTPVDEVLLGVRDLIASGKVLYFAFSDTPAWVVSYALAKAECFGWPKPVALQIPYSVLSRTVERAELPMARTHGLAILPWGILSGGTLTGKYRQASDEPRRDRGTSERELMAGDVIVELARVLGHTPAQVCLNWVRQQPGLILPILGARTPTQLADNLGCLDWQLPDDALSRLDAIADFQPGFPNSFLHSDHVRGLIFGDSYARLC
jgi:aryl-alcohol dehydrogenase-like predicted oxidoreductase